MVSMRSCSWLEGSDRRPTLANLERQEIISSSSCLREYGERQRTKHHLASSGVGCSVGTGKRSLQSASIIAEAAPSEHPSRVYIDGLVRKRVIAVRSLKFS